MNERMRASTCAAAGSVSKKPCVGPGMASSSLSFDALSRKSVCLACQHGRADVACLLLGRMGDGPDQDEREVLVELPLLGIREVVALARPRDRKRERAHAERQREGLGQLAAPRLEVRVAQTREP